MAKKMGEKEMTTRRHAEVFVYVLLAVGFMAGTAQSATVTYLGLDSTTGPAWRTTTVSKSGVFDPNGDNAYGSDGYYFGTNLDGETTSTTAKMVELEPAYISSLANSGSFYVKVSAYQHFDAPGQPIGTSVADIAGGLFYSSGTKFTFTVTSDANFVLAVLIGRGNPAAPSSITVTQTAGSGSGTATTDSAPTLGPSYAFFNIVASVGDSFEVDIVAGSNAGITGLGFEEVADPFIELNNSSVASNAAPGTLVGDLGMVNTNGTFSYSLKTSGDYACFDIPTGTTNLRTAAWIDAASYSISIIGTETGGGGLVVTNDFTITVDPATDEIPDFMVSAEVLDGATDGTLVGTAQTIQSGATFSISAGRDDLFYFDGSDLKLTNAASWGSIGTTNYVTLQAVVGTGTNELVVAATVVDTATSGTIFRFL